MRNNGFMHHSSEKLWDYFENLWGDPAEYKVLVSEHMLCLNQALITERESGEIKQDPADNIMSGTAFLLSAARIADRYAYKKKFPRILICEDVMIRGRNVAVLIETFRKIVKDCLDAVGVQVNETRLSADLYKSVGIYVFARSADEELLINNGKYRIFRAQVLPVMDLRMLIAQISSYLQNAKAVRTPYLLSAQLPWYQFSPSDFHVRPFIYKGMRQYVFVKNRTPHIAETVRISCHGGNEGGILTGMPLFGNIDEQSFKTLCGHIADYMERNMRYSPIAAYLRMDYPGLTVPKLQLILFLYSVLSTADFCRQTLNIKGSELYKTLVSDIYICFVHFGNNELFRYEILSLIKYLVSPKPDTSEIWDMLDRAAEAPYIIEKEDLHENFIPVYGPEEDDRRKLYEDTEDIFYETGMDSEYDIRRRIRRGIKYTAEEDDPDTLSFHRYMQIMGRKKNDIEHSVGCLFGLVDSGTVSMIQKQNGNVAEIAVRATELSLSILPERFQIFFPALAEVEKSCKRTGADTVDSVSSFIDSITPYDHRNNKPADMRDRHMVENLRKKKYLLLSMYSAAQNFTDWTECLEHRKVHNAENKDIGAFTNSERQERENYFLTLAKDFVNA